MKIGVFSFFLIAVTLLWAKDTHAAIVCASGTASGNGTSSTTTVCWPDDTFPSGGGGGMNGSGSSNSGGGEGGGGGSTSPPTSAQQAHLEKCATAYGSYQGKQGPNPAYTTKFSNQYGWYADNAGGAEVDWQATPSATQPVGAPECQGKIWLQNDGTTFPVTNSCNGTTWAGKTTIIWVSAYSSDARMVNVLAHEWAHQWGADEANAKYAGDAAQQAFEQDHGQKCQ
ncbi:MAG: hypothetical protein ACYC7G_02070 [Rudaea sp.]